MRRETVWFPAAFFAHRKAMKRGLQQRAHTQRYAADFAARADEAGGNLCVCQRPCRSLGSHGSFHAPKQVNMTAR